MVPAVAVSPSTWPQSYRFAHGVFQENISEESPTLGDFVPGEVNVGLVDTVTYQFITEFFNTINLKINSLDLGHNFWATADSNDLDYYRDLFSNDTTVVYVNRLSLATADTLLITITFTGVNSLSQDSSRVESIGLHIYRISQHPKFANLSVVIGQELCWADKLVQYDFISFAEPNYYYGIGLPKEMGVAARPSPPLDL